MKISQRGLDLIKELEGFSSVPYLCPAGKWTIGYGHVLVDGDGIKKEDKITKQQANLLLLKDLKGFENLINNNVTVPLQQGQFDALVSLTYNIGPQAFRKSTLLKLLNKSDYQAAAAQFARWNKVNKKPVAGLTRRRAAEAALFLENEVYEMPQAVDQPSKSLAVSRTMIGSTVSAGAGGLSIANGMLLNDAATIATETATTISTTVDTSKEAFTFLGMDVQTLVIIAGIIGIIGAGLAMYARYNDWKEGRL